MRRTTKKFSYFHVFALCLAAIAGVISSAFIPDAYALDEAGERLITIHDRGQEKGLITKADTLREVFKEANISLDKNDLVEPGLDEKLVTNNYQVNLYRARPVVIVDGKVQQLVMSAYQTPQQIAEHAGITLQDEDDASLDLSSNFIRDGASMRLLIDRASPVKLTLYGKTETVYTQATTVEEFLKEKNITVGEKDTLSVNQSEAIESGMKIELWRNGKQVITKEEVIAFDVEQIQDTDRDPSYKKINTPGENGKKMVTYEIVMKNGKQVSNKAIQTVITKQAKKQVETVGAKFNYTGGPLNEKQITALGMCETGMNPTTNTGNGFYGAFQFMSGTWQTVAPAPYSSKLPHEAPLEAQKQAVQTLLSRSSIYTQFPGCAKQMAADGLL